MTESLMTINNIFFDIIVCSLKFKCPASKTSFELDFPENKFLKHVYL